MKNQIIPALTLLVILVVLGWYIDSVAHDEIVTVARLVAYAVAFIAIFAILVGTIVLLLLIVERLLTVRARRKAAQCEADVLVVTADEDAQVYIRDMNTAANWRNAHLDSRVYINGPQMKPTSIEITNYQLRLARHQRRSITQVTPQVLSAPPQIDLLTALDNVQRCLIVGASDSGKTTLLQHLTSRKLNSSKVIVVDPHGWPGKYPKDCIVIGTGRNYAEIDRALAALIKLMTKRYDEIGKGLVVEMGHSRLTIIIDEWRAIVGNLGKSASEAIKALLTESRKAAFSVFVATHSDRAKPLGLEGEYDLKDGFAVVRLSVVNGQRQAILDTGNGEQLAILPGPFVTGGEVIDSEDFIDLDAEPKPEPELKPADELFRELVQSGKSRRAAALQAYGKEYAGSLVSHCKRVLGEI